MELVYGEIQSPQYRRSFTLSRELDPGKIEAKLANGVLNLRIPKAEEARPRRIEISARLPAGCAPSCLRRHPSSAPPEPWARAFRATVIRSGPRKEWASWRR